MKLTYFDLPKPMQAGIENWVLYGIKPGSFLTAVLKNDLSEAALRADSDNFKILGDYVYILNSLIPAECWGSVENFDNWKIKMEAKQKQVVMKC